MDLNFWKRSSLFNSFSETWQENEIIDQFNQICLEKHMEKEDIETLMYTYQNIDFNKHNVHKYLDFLCYFGFDTLKEITNFIVLKHLHPKDLFDEISNIGVVQRRPR